MTKSMAKATKSFVGIVKSNKTDKTIVVIVQTRKTHPIYRKQYTDSRNFMVHDENNEAEVGDRVRIVECRPMSALKRFKLDKILEKPLLREATYGDEPATEESEEKPSAKRGGEQ
jgi:small subunit ribosomal protein S17